MFEQMGRSRKDRLRARWGPDDRRARGLPWTCLCQAIARAGRPRKDDGSETSRALEYASDPNLSDAEKLLKATSFGPDPKVLLQPIFDFGDAIQQDQLTKQMVQLYAKDELGSATWVYETCAMLNGKGAAAPAMA